MSPSSARLRVPASQSRSRPRHSRNASASSALYLPQGPESLILPDGHVGDETVDLLQDFVHHIHGHGAEDTLIVDEPEEEPAGSDDILQEDWEALKMKPWFRRPTPWWLLCMMPLSAIAMSATVAPRVEIYTDLACRAHKPEYTVGRQPPDLDNVLWDDSLSGNADAGRILWVSDRSEQIFTNGGSFPSDIFTLQSLIQPIQFMSNDTILDEDPEKSNPCASDPEVQAAVAKLIAAMTSSMGILSCLTTGWWGSLSDRHGRLRVMGISVIGLLLTDFNFIFVSFFSDKLPGGYWFLIAGPLIEGSLGGMTSAIAAMHAYIADCTEPGARSRIFSLSLGLLFTGMAIGPTLGALLIRATQHTLVVFYLATATHLCFAMHVWFAVPESLSARAMTANRARRAADAAAALSVEQEERARGRRGLCAMLRFKRLFGFLSPLSVLAPRLQDVEGSPGKRPRRDWNLVLLALSHAFSVMVMASYQFKFQYAAATFGWGSEELGYWLSLVGASRAIYLTVLLPVAIKFFKPTPPPIHLPIEPSEPLHGEPSSPTSTGAAPAPASPVGAGRPRHSPAFDLGLARFSLAYEIVCYTLIPLAPTPALFTVASMLTSFGGGFGPAMQSLALELYARRGAGARETGRLFGALSVIQAMSSQILGPALFGLTYVKTVGTYPKTIFFLSSGAVAVSLVFLSFVRLPRAARADDVEGAVRPRVDRERTLVDTDVPDELARGRKVAKSPVLISV